MREAEMYEDVLAVATEEDDSTIVGFASDKRAAMLALIAPYVPGKVSPTRALFAELGPPEEFGIESFILKAKRAGCTDLLYLLIHSFGGGVAAAYVMAKALRRNFRQITVLVPQIAASGATLLAITSDRIVMGEISRLSPIDVQLVVGGERRSALALLRGFAKLDKRFQKTAQHDITYPYRHLIESIDLTTYEEWSGMLAEMEGYASPLLAMAGYGDREARQIATALVYGFSSHDEVIDFEKARNLGLKVSWYEEHEQEWAVARRWLAKYLLEESSIHHVRYALPMEVADE